MDQKNKIIKKIQDENYNLKKKLIKFDNINTNFKIIFLQIAEINRIIMTIKILFLYVKLIML